MDSNNVVIKYLGTLGYNPSTSYYGYIELWKEWYENFVPKFHEYHDQNGDKRELYKLGMAKRLCEDWSSILYTEKETNKQTGISYKNISRVCNKIKKTTGGYHWEFI